MSNASSTEFAGSCILGSGSCARACTSGSGDTRSCTGVGPRRRIQQTSRLILSATASAVGVDARLILSRDRHASIAFARRVAMTVARRLGYSLPEIGLAFDRNHTTVLYAVRTTEREASETPAIADLLEHIAAVVSGEHADPDERERYHEAAEAILVTTAERDLLAEDVQRLAAEVAGLKADRDAARAEAHKLRRQMRRASRGLAQRRKTRTAHYQDGYRAGRRNTQRALQAQKDALRAERSSLRDTIKAAAAAAAAATAAQHSAPTQVLVGSYDSDTGRRRVVLAISATERTLLDVGPGDDDVRVIERFSSRDRLAPITAIAVDYVVQATRERKPGVRAAVTSEPAANDLAGTV